MSWAWLRSVLLAGLGVAIALYFVVAFGQQAWRARELEAQVAEQRRALAAIVAERDARAQELSELEGTHYRAYVEQAARRELNLAYPGETVLLVHWRASSSPVVTPTPVPTPTLRPNWLRWLEILHLTGS